jgi:hypothetical protein
VIVTVSTKRLIELLTDALQTSSEELPGIHIATHRAADCEEPGVTDLLSATSTTGYVLGHSWVQVIGQLPAAVWPHNSTRTALAVLKDLARKSGGQDEESTHTVDIRVELADAEADNGPENHPGWTITILETPALFDGDTEFQFHAEHASKAPIESLASLLAGIESTTRLEQSQEDIPLTKWSPGVLAALVAIAKRRKAQIEVYRQAGRRSHRVQIGHQWLGVAMPATITPEERSDSPSITALIVPDSAIADTARAS